MSLPIPDAWITAGFLVLMFTALVRGRIGPDLIVLGTLAGLMVTGVLDPIEGIRGFASPGLATVAMLYIVAEGIKQTGALTFLTERLLGRATTARQVHLRLLLPVAAASAFVNNTPIVAMFLPVLSNLAKRTGIPVGQLFMPLSFAAILGGLCTLIGTSTNLVVNGLIIEHNNLFPDDPLPEFNMFTLSLVGVPLALVGVAYIVLLSRRLLPGNAAPAGPTASREYMTAVRVETSSSIVGKTLEQAGLRHLPGLFLSRIDRGTDRLYAVGPMERLESDDILVFVGRLESVVDLQKIKGIVPATEGDYADQGARPTLQLLEAVVSQRSPLIGRTIRDAGFRTRYGAVIVAVHRQGHKITGKIGDIRLQPGDTLLLEAARGFAQRFGDSTDFYLVSELDGAATPRHNRAWIAMLTLAALVVTVALLGWSTVTASITAACVMILMRCCTGPQARRSIDWSVLLIIGGAFGIGHAMESSGLATILAGFAVDLVAPITSPERPWALLAVIYGLTVMFTAAVNNNAAAVLMFPVMLQATEAAGIPFLPAVVCLAVAATAEFSSPIGYQTNLIVMGPGGYKWLDYTRFGGPLTILIGLLCVGLAPLLY